jgi:hypothetical protein
MEADNELSEFPEFMKECKLGNLLKVVRRIY